jgi:hypothetical protein
MGAKHVCFNCRKASNVPYGHVGPTTCSDCGQHLEILSQRFRPPKKREQQKWETAKYLVDHGFYYHEHIGFDNIAPVNKPKGEGYLVQNYVQYPENLREAKEFVVKYHAYARKRA